MPRFLIDEDLPRLLSVYLQQKGNEAVHVTDVGLRAAPDHEIFVRAQERRAILISRDLGFSNILQYPPGSHYGIVVVRFPSEIRSQALVNELVERLAAIGEAEFAGALIILEPSQIRIRRKPPRIGS